MIRKEKRGREEMKRKEKKRKEEKRREEEKKREEKTIGQKRRECVIAEMKWTARRIYTSSEVTERCWSREYFH